MKKTRAELEAHFEARLREKLSDDWDIDDASVGKLLESEKRVYTATVVGYAFNGVRCTPHATGSDPDNVIAYLLARIAELEKVPE